MRENLVGKKFGRLLVIKSTNRRKRGTYYWICKCNCGNVVEILGKNLKDSTTKSCGCLQRDITRKMGKMHITHGMTNTATYGCWYSMKQRCFNENCSEFHNYGGRGINICKRWLKFENFYSDMKEKPKHKTLDRIDNNGNYCKKNCRWATNKEQGRNTRNNKNVTFNGETFCMATWAEKLNVNYHTLYNRLYNGWSVEKAFNKR